MKSSKQREVINAYLDDDASTIIIHERTEDGGAAQRRASAEYVTFHWNEQIGKEALRQLKSLDSVRSIREDGPFLRIGWTDEYTRRNGCRGMRTNDVETFEGDVDPVLLWLVENRVTIAKPRRCYLDLEADSHVLLSQKEEMRILSWALIDGQTGEKHSMLLEADTEKGEAHLLTVLAKLLKNYDQICVWEGDFKGGEFDSVVLPARWRKCGVSVDERDWLWLNQLAVWRRMNMHTAESGAEKESFKLGDIAYEQLGRGKEIVPDFVRDRFGDKCDRGLAAITRELWDEGGEFRELLLEYNVSDALLLYDLEDKKGYINLFQALCNVCGIPPITKHLQPTRQMDGFMLRLGRERNHRFPTKWYRDEEEVEEEQKQFRGAVVFHPKSVPGDKDGMHRWTVDDARAWRTENGLHNGILREVHVCDFASLYPSVMRTWNLSGDVCIGWAKTLEEAKHGNPEFGDNLCVSPGTHLVTRNDEIGFIPLALAELIRLRKHWSDLAVTLFGTPEGKDAMAQSTAYKVAANSFYGAGGSKYSRFNHRDVSEATTQNSVHLLRLTAKHAEARDMIVAYGDTDSVFVMGPTEKGFRSYVTWLNTKFFPREIASFGCKENFINLAFEKTFERVVFVSAKAYVGRFSQYKGARAKRECYGITVPHEEQIFKHEERCSVCGSHGVLSGEPEIKGLAWKRGDKGKLARELQGKIIDCLVGGVKLRNKKGEKVPINPGIVTPTDDLEVYLGLIERARDHVLSDPLPLHEVRMSKSLSKSLREYGKSATDAHVRVGRILKERGHVIGKGSRIEYVVVDGSVSPQQVIPVEDYSGECDRFWLWERVYQPTKSLLQAAFPDRTKEWDEWGNVRPKKARKGKKTLPGQMGLSLSTRIGENDELAVPAYKATPLYVRIPEDVGLPGVDRVKEVFQQYPGARSVIIVIALKSGQEAVLNTDLRVSPGPKFKEAIEAAISYVETS